MNEGLVVWRDLMSTDPEVSIAFYGELFGWKAQTTEGPFGPYLKLFSGERGICGVLPLDMAHGMPSHWLNYLAVVDVDVACEQAQTLGGDVPVKPFNAKGVGRWAVIRDNTGAHFLPFKGETSQKIDLSKPADDFTFCWSQLNTPDVEAAAHFYKTITGLDNKAMPGPDEANPGPLKAILFKKDGIPCGSAVQLPRGSSIQAHWLNYISVPNIDVYDVRAQSLGANSILPPTSVPGLGKITILSDPTGAEFVLWTNSGNQIALPKKKR